MMRVQVLSCSGVELSRCQVVRVLSCSGVELFICRGC